MTKHTRQCPICTKELTYSNSSSLNQANKRNSCCRTCARINVKRQPTFKTYICTYCNKEKTRGNGFPVISYSGDYNYHTYGRICQCEDCFKDYVSRFFGELNGEEERTYATKEWK